jgi:hypothetical protein
MIAPTSATTYTYHVPGTVSAPGVRNARTNDGTPTADTASATLTPEQQRELAELQKRDREVRAHELAHVAAGAGLVTRGASFTYETGPDGQRYAVAGEVGIDTSPGRTPEETLHKAEQVRAAALAPANPSAQDFSVAAAAARMAQEARLEIATESAGSDPLGTAAHRADDIASARAARFAPDALTPTQNGQLIDLFA